MVFYFLMGSFRILLKKIKLIHHKQEDSLNQEESLSSHTYVPSVPKHEKLYWQGVAPS